MLGAISTRRALVPAALLAVALSAATSSAGTLSLVPANAAPGRAIVTVGKNETVKSTVHYQAYITLACEGNACNATFPAVGANRRVNLTSVSCAISTEFDSAVEFAELSVSDNTRFVTMVALPVEMSTRGATHLLERAVDVQVEATQHVNVGIALVGTGRNGFCSLAGTLDVVTP